MADDCCGNEAWRGHLCPYHEGFEDGKAEPADEIERLRGLVARLWPFATSTRRLRGGTLYHEAKEATDG